MSGQSLSINGTRPGGVGASFIAQGGGFCEADNRGSSIFESQTYGEFDMVPHSDYLAKYYS